MDPAPDRPPTDRFTTERLRRAADLWLLDFLFFEWMDDFSNADLARLILRCHRLPHHLLTHDP